MGWVRSGFDSRHSDPEMNKVTQAAEAWVKQLLAQDASGHDWYHIDRVRKMALRIAAEENVDVLKVELMALLHELPDKKLNLFPDEAAALTAIRTWLTKHDLAAPDVEEILEVISLQSYSKSGVTGQKLTSKTGQVMQDADRLEAIGAIGIARCFAYGGSRGRPLHVPSIGTRKNLNEDAIINSDSSLQHFYEKLLRVKNHMNTETGKRLAAHRHKIIEEFLAEFLAEWDGER